MAENIPTRSEALALFKEYNQSESLLKHALAVEGVMLHFAELLGEPDPEKWAIIGLVHDLDYEKHPEEHCRKVREILQSRNWPESYIRAIQSHGFGLCSDIEPRVKMEWVLYTIDELTGLIVAAALVRPSKSVLDLEVKSVKKRWKEKGFAAGVNRKIIEAGAVKLGMALDEVIAETIGGMQKVASSIGLAGSINTSRNQVIT